MIIVFRRIFPYSYVGLSVWPFIFLRDRDLMGDQILINHERIHQRQQLEMLLLPFYIWYLTEWLYRWVRCGDPYQAYRDISFEREAYSQEANPAYLTRRKPFSFLRYR